MNCAASNTKKLGAVAEASALRAATAAPMTIGVFAPQRSTNAPAGMSATVRPTSCAVMTWIATAPETSKASPTWGRAGMIIPWPRLMSMDGK